MDNSTLLMAAILGVALVEGVNGLSFAFRGRKTLESAGLPYHPGPGLLIQEFGVYSIAISLAYLAALLVPGWRTGVVVVGVLINVAAACMHLSRSVGGYFGGAIPGLSSRSERNQGIVHVLSASVLGVALIAAAPPRL